MMMGNTSPGYGQGRIAIWIFLWVVTLVIGLVLVGLGLWWGSLAPMEPAESAAATAAAVAQLTPAGIIIPTNTPLPAITATNTPIPPTDTPVVPYVEALENGLNIRTGPGTNFTRLGHVDPGTQLTVVGRYSNWFQIDFNGTLAWVSGDVVNAYNVENVGQVVPPSSPTPRPPTATPTATPIPATPVPAVTPTPNTHGVQVNAFVVGHKVGTGTVGPYAGPFGNAGDVWFYMDITNKSGGYLELTKWGVWVQENSSFKVSWGVADPLRLSPGQRFDWVDHMKPENMPNVGTYNLWMRACFSDGSCANIAGPSPVTIG